MMAGLMRRAAVTLERVTVVIVTPYESLIEVLVTNLQLPFVLEGLYRSLYTNVIPLMRKKKWQVKAVDSTARGLLRTQAFAPLTQALVLEEVAPRA